MPKDCEVVACQFGFHNVFYCFRQSCDYNVCIVLSFAILGPNDLPHIIHNSFLDCLAR